MNERTVMKEEVRVESEELTPPSLARRVSWGAIIAGFFVTMVIQLTLTLLGAAVGVASLESFRAQPSGQRMAITSGIWLLVTGLISIWVGSCVAGRLCGGPRRADGLIHGIVAWSVSTCATIALLATAIGTVVGGTGSLIGGALSLGNLTRSGETTAPLQEQVKNLFPQTGSLLAPTGRTEKGPQPPGKLTELAEQDPQLSAALTDMEKKGGVSQATQERDKIVAMLQSHNLEQKEAENLVQQWDQEFQKAQSAGGQNAASGAQDTPTRGVASGALWGFIALMLGLIFAAWGGWVGTASLPYGEAVKTAG